MGLARRLAILAAAMAVVLILMATEFTLSWSERSRLDDRRQEGLALASTLGDFLLEVTPRGEPDSLSEALGDWAGLHLTTIGASVFRRDTTGHLALVARSDTVAPVVAGPYQQQALNERARIVVLEEGIEPGWLVCQPIGRPIPFGVLSLKVSTSRLNAWTRGERKLAYTFAALAALLLSAGIVVLTSRWVGRPLAELTHAMAGARTGARSAPKAEEVGPAEFRAVARRYNELTEALADRERAFEAQASLMALEERARGFERLALMDEATASFAHEIGTPLHTMSGHFQLLREDLGSNGAGDGQRRVDLLLGQVERVSTIVRAWLERGSWPSPRIRTTELQTLGRELIEFLHPTSAEAGVILRSADGSAPILARCDPSMVEQILLNLLKNAIEALAPGDAVELGYGADATQSWITVSDDGPGLPEDFKQKIFNPFATTKGSQGTGLGLTISRRLARLQGGDLIYEPTERGTRWKLVLPLSLESHDEASSPLPVG